MKIKGTEWDEIVFPKPLTDEDRVREKELDRLLGEIKPCISKIEKFFNNVFPNIEWGGHEKEI